jgi:hypothetical protein
LPERIPGQRFRARTDNRSQIECDRLHRDRRYRIRYCRRSLTPAIGRIVGYDNAHGQHHRHYFEHVDCVKFESYEKLESQFEAQVRQYLETGTC